MHQFNYISTPEPSVSSRVTEPLFFYEITRLLKQNGGEWTGELAELPAVLKLPLTPRAAYLRLLRHAEEYRLKVTYLDKAKTRVRLVKGGRGA